MKHEDIKTKLLLAGVKNLKEFGYPEVNTSNIQTDEVYSEFFKSMLNDNKGYSLSFDIAIDELLANIKNSKK